MRTREEHLAWCKTRALEYVDHGDLRQALTSMGSDLTKHDETKNHPAITIMVQLMLLGKLSSSDEVTRFINGFH